MRVVRGRAEEQPVDEYGVALAKALAPPPVAAEWCLPLVAPGGAAILLVGPSADAAAVARVSEQLGGGEPEGHPGAAGAPEARAHSARFPAPRRDGEEAAAGLGRKEPSAREERMFQVSGRVYAVANQKGGVGKTTTAVNLAACLAEAGERALVVDLDPQANATSGLGERANGTSSYDLLDGAPLEELAKPTRFQNLWLVPSKPDLAGAAVELARREDGEKFLAESLAGAGDGYAFVFLDCPPSLGPLTVNALAAADRVLVPVQAEYYALEGLSQLLRSVDIIKARLNPRLGIAGVLLTMVDGRTRLSAEVDAEVRRHLGELVFKTTVPRSVRLAEAPSHGLPAIAYDRPSAGAEAYWKVAMELVERSCQAGTPDDREPGRPRPAGRGLGSPDRRRRDQRELEQLPVEAIHPNPRQPRKRHDAEAASGLADSVRAQGVIQPVVVRRRVEGGWELIAGERRWRAAREAGLATLPAVVREADDRDSLLLALVENVAREELSPVEEARAYALLIDEFGLSLGEVSERVGRSKPAVSNRMRLLDLPDDVLGMVERGELSRGPRPRGARRARPGGPPPARARDRQDGDVRARCGGKGALGRRQAEAAQERRAGRSRRSPPRARRRRAADGPAGAA